MIFTQLASQRHKSNKLKGCNMLVLSRKKDEQIILRNPNMDDIIITIVRIDNRNKVRIGVEANNQITVLRSELDSTINSLSVKGE